MRREVAGVFIVAAQSAIQPSFPVAMVFFKTGNRKDALCHVAR